MICHEGEQSDCGNYISGVKLGETCFLISNTRVLRQQKLYCNSRNTSAPYILIYKKRNNFLIAPPNSLNGFAEGFPASEVITETPETVIQQSVLQELAK